MINPEAKKEAMPKMGEAAFMKPSGKNKSKSKDYFS